MPCGLLEVKANALLSTQLGSYSYDIDMSCIAYADGLQYWVCIWSRIVEWGRDRPAHRLQAPLDGWDLGTYVKLIDLQRHDIRRTSWRNFESGGST